jgi:hypothetical protein
MAEGYIQKLACLDFCQVRIICGRCHRAQAAVPSLSTGRSTALRGGGLPSATQGKLGWGRLVTTMAEGYIQLLTYVVFCKFGLSAGGASRTGGGAASVDREVDSPVLGRISVRYLEEVFQGYSKAPLQTCLCFTYAPKQLNLSPHQFNLCSKIAQPMFQNSSTYVPK